jgi:hypothetical protein
MGETVSGIFSGSTTQRVPVLKGAGLLGTPTNIVLKSFVHVIAKILFLCYKVKIVPEVFRNPQSYQKSQKGKTFEAEMIRSQGAKALWGKRASKKRKPAKSEFPSLTGFLF